MFETGVSRRPKGRARPSSEFHGSTDGTDEHHVHRVARRLSNVRVNHAQHLYRRAVVTIELLPRPTPLLHHAHEVDLQLPLFWPDRLDRELNQQLERPLIDPVEGGFLDVMTREVRLWRAIDAPLEDMGIEGDRLSSITPAC